MNDEEIIEKAKTLLSSKYANETIKSMLNDIVDEIMHSVENQIDKFGFSMSNKEDIEKSIREWFLYLADKKENLNVKNVKVQVVRIIDMHHFDTIRFVFHVLADEFEYQIIRDRGSDKFLF